VSRIFRTFEFSPSELVATLILRRILVQVPGTLPIPGIMSECRGVKERGKWDDSGTFSTAPLSPGF